MIPQSKYNQRSGSSWLQTGIYTLAFFLTCLTLSAQTDTTCTAKVGNYKSTSVCFSDNQTILKTDYQVKATTPVGFKVVYLLGYANHTGVAPVIQQIANEPLFPLPVSPQGVYTVHELVYNPATLNLNDVVLNETTVAKLKTALTGTCSALDANGATVQFGECATDCAATAGRLVATANPCVKGGEAKITANIQSAPIIPAGYQRLYALVNTADGEILRFGPNPSFTVGVAGNYGIHTLVYDTATLNLDQLYNVGIVTLTSIDTLLIQGGGMICGALDLVGATFQLENCPEPCQASAGTLAVDSNPCLKDSAVVIRAVTKTSSAMPAGHRVRYLLSTGSQKLVQRIDTIPAFAVSDTGTYTIHTLVYNPANFNPDSLTLDSLTAAALNQRLDTLCGDVDLTGAVFKVQACPTFICSASAGFLIANDSTCLFNGTAKLTATVGLAPLVPFGYKSIYLLADDSLVIKKVGTTPSFEVTEAGRFSIHTLVYDTANIKIDSIRFGETTVLDMYALLTPGGGTFCGALDTAGAVFQLEVCADCPAKAGTLTSNTDPCLKDSVAVLTAYNKDLPVVPSGFKLAYLLSGGTGKVIEQVSDSAVFVVNRMDGFAIHTLVYDVAALKLDSIKLGVTTINKLNTWFIQGGGNMCGALDTKGFSFFVIPCPIQCDAKAGSLQSIGQTCLEQGTAIIEAAFATQPVVPAGFAVRYLLSVSDLHIIRQISTVPSFAVTTVDNYTIHTLVYDPNALNLSTIQLGITSIETVNALLVPAGGEICGALDKKGLSFEVLACEEDCQIDVGQLGNFNPFVCITNGSATLSAFVQSDASVPSGFKLKYLLTSGSTNQIIEQTSDNPVFRVNRTGRFTIHTLVYNSNTLSIGSLILGSTRLDDLNQKLVQGGGAICAGLDLTGVVFQVGTCVGDGSEETELRAYPNPATQKLNLVLPYAENVTRTTVELINSNGDLIDTWQVDGYNPALYLDISTVQPGVYYARVYYDGAFIQQTSVIRAQ